MTAHPPSSSAPGFPAPNQGRRRLLRWSLIGVSAAVIVLIGAVAVYAVTTSTDDPAAVGEIVAPSAAPSSVPPRARTEPPLALLPTAQPEQPEPGFDCLQVIGILGDMMAGVDVDYVETRRAAADQLRDLAVEHAAQREALETLAGELDAAAQMVEDDPGAELVAFEREDAAADAFIDSGACR